MWTEGENNSRTVISDRNSSKMVDPDLTRQLLHIVPHRNEQHMTNRRALKGSTAAATHPSGTEDSISSGSGIIPGTGSFSSRMKAGAIAATLFIAFLLGLYAILWKCMVSPPQRKHSKVRVRVKQRTSV